MWRCRGKNIVTRTRRTRDFRSLFIYNFFFILPEIRFNRKLLTQTTCASCLRLLSQDGKRKSILTKALHVLFSRNNDFDFAHRTNVTITSHVYRFLKKKIKLDSLLPAVYIVFRYSDTRVVYAPVKIVLKLLIKYTPYPTHMSSRQIFFYYRRR